MIRSLAARLTLLQQLTAIIVVVAFGLASLWITARVLRTERRAYVEKTAVQLAREYDEEFAEEGSSPLATSKVVEEAVEAGVRVEIRDAHGALLTRPPASAGSGPAGRRRGGEVYSASAVSQRGVRVVVEASGPWLANNLAVLAKALAIAAIPILLVALLIMRISVTRALRPLSTMAGRAASLSIERNPRSLGASSGLAELDLLATSFDRLLERLDDALRAERRLTADASHELRTPLMVLGGELEMLIERTPPESATAGSLRRAAEQVGAMRDLVDAILLLHRSGETGRSGADDFEIINLCDLARETLAEMRLRHPERAGDVTIEAPDEVLVRGRTSLLVSALRNLLDNGLKFTSPGAAVRLRVTERDELAILTVDDQGPGVPEHERERIFDPFFRGAEARAATGGFGLGLPILRRVARAHGGEVEVDVGPLGGARFTLCLPRLPASDALD